MDSKNFTIGVLSTTAVILLVGLLVINTRPDPAFASGMTVSGGVYSVTVGRLNQSEEMLYIIDSARERLLTFTFDSGRKSVVPVQALDLNRIRETGSPQQKAQQPTSPKSRRGTRPKRTRPPRP